MASFMLLFILLLFLFPNIFEARKSTEVPDVIVYTDEIDKDNKIQELKAEAVRRSRDTAAAEREKRKLEKEEAGLKQDVLRATLHYGEESREKATALHKLGRNIYKQERWEETIQISLEISRIHSVLDGLDSLPYADAIGNVGSVANRMRDKFLCEIVMKRQLKILLDKHGPESKEVLIQRARMMSFQIKDGETSEGLDQEEYLIKSSGIPALAAHFGSIPTSNVIATEL